MTTLQVINYIARSPHIKKVVINNDDKTPMQAIEYISFDIICNEWKINSSLEKNTLIVYDNQ